LKYWSYEHDELQLREKDSRGKDSNTTLLGQKDSNTIA
jgi:hypothetical protein